MKRNFIIVLVIGMSLIAHWGRAGDNPKADSLLAVLPSLTDPSELCKVNYAIAYYLYADAEKALPYAGEAFRLAKEQGEQESIARTGFAYAGLCEIVDDRQNAFLGYFAALESYSLLENELYLGRCHKAIGRLYVDGHQPDKAEQHFETAGALYAKQPTHLRSSYYWDLGDLYFEKKEYKDALGYYRVAESYSVDTTEMVSLIIGQGLAYFEMSEYAEAKQAYLKAKALAEFSAEKKYFSGLIENNLGVLNLRVGKYDQANTHFLNAQNFSASLDDVGKQLFLNGLAETWVSKGQSEAAFSLLQQSIALKESGEVLSNEELVRSYEMMITVCENLGKVPDALSYSKDFQELLVTQQEAENMISDAKAVLEIQLAENKMLGDKLEKANQERILWILVASSLGLVLVFFVLWRLYFRHRRLRMKYTRKQEVIRQLKHLAATEEW